ncbi:MAG: aminoacyl-tRNA hydrolase [Acidimicrobiia bacterium]|nr:aminoacyl-tRNA hydrolase [Acidimicrobiia bacterium]
MSTSRDRVLVGLRNPGLDYVGTRHNVGYEVVEVLAFDHKIELGNGPSGVRCDVATVRVDDTRLMLAAPQTYMNESGAAVRALLDYHSIEDSDLLVIHDDIDLPFGKVKVAFGGGAGGHNGLRSVIQHLGHRDFHRLKIGVGRPPGRMDPAVYVLNRFGKSEREEMDIVVSNAADIAHLWIADPEDARQRAGEI